MFEDNENQEGWRNPTFLLIAGILGVFVILSLLCITGVLLVNKNVNQPRQATAMAMASQQSATIYVALTATKRAEINPTVAYETTEDPNITQSNTIGELEVKYSAQMMPSEREIVLVHVSVPPQLVNVNLETLTRIQISTTGTTQIETLGKFKTNIRTAERMRVMLSSPTLQIEDVMESTQTIPTGIAGWITSWAWTIKAPEEYGTHIFTVNVYLLDDTVPAWLGSFNVMIR